MRARMRERELMAQIRSRPQRRAEEFNPEFDFSEDPKKDQTPE